ncbi:MAG: threonine-phosphate decarboxylase, partial [Pseudomonadota bacterium]
LLQQNMGRLETLLRGAGLTSCGGTRLFCLVKCAEAQRVFDSLGKAGIFVRRFEESPQLLRFGLPGGEQEWARLEDALGKMRLSP